MCNDILNKYEQILNSEEIALPLKDDKGNFEKTIKAYEQKLVKLLDDNNLKGLSENIKYKFKKILEIFKLSISGKKSSAYKEFDKMMNCNDDWNKMIYNRDDLTDKSFFRMRVKEPYSNEFSKEDLFHIPFEKRDIIKRQRYSLPGVPCLYLGGSTYISWLEMKKPEISKLVYSRFQLNEEKDDVFDILDLGYTPKLFCEFLEKKVEIENNKKKKILNYLESLPLIFACSVVNYKKSPFIEEYIMPQLLLSWIIENENRNKEKKNIGVRYFSTKNKDQFKLNDSHFLCNYAFPVLNDDACKNLKTIFKMTEPADCDIILNSSLQNDHEEHDSNETPTIKTTGEIQLVKGEIWEYESTVFGIMENRISLFYTKIIENNS